MLTFLYLAGCSLALPIIEKDVLKGAESNVFGYLTAYKGLIPMESLKWAEQIPVKIRAKLGVLFRPINVPFKCKWLRESARDLENSVHVLSPQLITAHS
jgi:hypothetical protein